MNIKLLAGLIIVTQAIAMPAMATIYTYEVSNDQTWSDGGTSSTQTQYATVRSYVPGSSTTTYSNVILYTPTYTSESNALGDVVGTVYSIYGTGNTAFVVPYDGPKTTVIYPVYQILHTRLFAINNDRLALGNFFTLGGSGKGFIYDVIYDQYTPLVAPDTEWTSAADINNPGRIVGVRINDGGATRTGFTYDCVNGFQAFEIPGASWTVPSKIDDQGNIYGFVSGIPDAAYFIARPDTVEDLSGCSLVPRDDVPEPVAFGMSNTFEMSGDVAQAVRIADFDGGGINDLLVYHEPGKTILYLGEGDFDSKIRYYGDEFNTLAQGVVLETQWDFNNDGIFDKLVRSNKNRLYHSKPDGSFYYVPQELPQGVMEIGDMNGDGLVDIVIFDGPFATVHFHIDTTVANDPTTSDPGTTTDTGTGTDSGNIPAVDPNAPEVELTDTVSGVGNNNVLLSSGQTLWFNADTIIIYNDSTGFEVGQELQVKARENPDGALIGIKVELP